MESQDILIATIYFLLFALSGLIIHLFKSDDPRYKYFFPALLLKLIGGLAFALVYKYYYGYGDTFAYFYNSLPLTEMLVENTGRGMEILFYFKNDIGREVAADFGGLNRIINSHNTFLVVKIAAVLNLLSFSNFFGTTLLFSVLSFTGMWLGFLAVIQELKGKHVIRNASIAFFLIPSVFFWGSGLMKDSLVIGFLGFIIYGIIPIGKAKLPGLLRLTLLLLAGYIIFIVKAYVIFCLVPALAYWLFLSSKAKIRNMVVRSVIAPIALVLLMGSVVVSVTFLGQFTEKFQIDTAFETAKVYQDYHYTGENSAGRGSGYFLPDYGNIFTNAILNIPTAINVTLFRPYIWEISSPVVALAALESIILLILSIRLIIRKGFWALIRFCREKPFLMFALVFSLLFAYVIGFSSYNFGALVRYKIQCIPLFVFLVLSLESMLPNKSELRRSRSARRS